MKKIITISLFLLTLSCNSLQDKYFSSLKGEWQIVKFYYKDKDLMLEEYYLIGFENRNNLWLKRKVNREINIANSNYKIHSDSNILKIYIINCEDVRLNGNYDIHIDTIQDNDEDYIIRMWLDNEDTYIEAIRSKLKYNDYNEFQRKIKP